jgi:FAD/FMN-containing dehydrogenase
MVELHITTTSGAQGKLAGEAIDAFRHTMRGAVLSPADDSYNEMRQVWNGLIDRRPALIARCTGTADVIDAVSFARAHNLLVSVRGGGHNVAGAAVCDGGLMIDLSLMKGIHVDPQQRTARAQAGVTWGDLDRETQAFGLAAPGGVVSTTGIAGLTLGGGLGWLRSKYGLACDNLISVDLVTASGELVRASANENSDLFWGIRGGGGNFGIVTSFEYQLHPVGPQVMMCVAMYPAEDAPTILPAWRDFVEQAPDEVSSQAYFWGIPAVEGFPTEIWNKPLVIITAMYAGDSAQGERFLNPLRQLATPVVDISGQMPYTTAQTLFDPFLPKAQRYYYFKSTDLARLDDEVIDALIACGKDRPAPSVLLAIWHYGGAMRRVGENESAFGSRRTPYLFSVDAIWDDPAQTESIIAWSREQITAMKPYSSGGLYVNFSGFGEEGEQLVRAIYGQNYERLARLKQQYDPTNLFHLNQNIRPTGVTAHTN